MTHALVQLQLTQKLYYIKECIYMAQSNSNSSNQLVVPGAQQAIDQMKYEIASEFGVNLGAETTSRANGSVGGEITKRLVSFAQSNMSGFSK
jgi:small acid-soluble spore protein A (major alpha-type SASP)